jgi:hypothetical protein
MNAFLTDLLKHAGATTMFAFTTARMPLQAIAFSLPLLMGEAARPFTQTDIASLAVIGGHPRRQERGRRAAGGAEGQGRVIDLPATSPPSAHRL